jgi:photosystem II stability/assembly factor-like uncharacterized protein
MSSEMSHAQRRRARRDSRRQRAQSKRQIWWAVGAGLVIALAVVAVALFSGGDTGAAEQPVASISHQYSPNHLHGIGYDAERGRVLLASHFGLFAREDGQLYQVGDSRDDFMGFAQHPSDPSVLYVSGHPFDGGNLGVKRSDDGGLTWELLFTGVAGETVDFHSMTISAANPNVLYGWFQGRIYRTFDGGASWSSIEPNGLPPQGLCWGAPCLAGDGQDASVVYAGTPQGLMVSNDAGETWEIVNAEVGSMAALTVDHTTPGRLVAFTETLGLAVSRDGGETWESLPAQPPASADEFAFAIVLDPTDQGRLYVATIHSRVFETTDGGVTWTEIASP